jgi:serine/threonine protein kinase
MAVDEKAIFVAALAFPNAHERQAYLREACAGQPELLGPLYELLAAHDEPKGPLDRPPTVLGLPPSAPPETAGARIGPYELVQPIGEGGMGSVWLAQQTEPVQRLVALKLIKAGMGWGAVLARFEAERQALALMDHPNIARALDAGATLDGRPYFVMELVKGAPITQYCDEHRLTPQQRLELFVPVCQAIQHAHQKGIIHRDIKPSNVLVASYDGKPVPKVIDFGIAKAIGEPLTEQTLHTGLGTVVGTAEYMSPEQASLNHQDVDTRSDVYSLGVLLYELLAGSPPFSRKGLGQDSLFELLRVIREQEPPRPSIRLSTAEGLAALAANRGTEPRKLSGLVRGELDWIVMKCLEKDRNRRYETANGLARDLERYLKDEPVLACPPSAGYRLRMFVRRNKGPVLAGTALLVALLAGIFGTSVGFVTAISERDEKEQARLAAVARGEEAREAAEAHRKARGLAQRRLGQIEKANEIIAEVFSELGSEEEADGQPLRARLGARLEAAAALLDNEATGGPVAVAHLQHKLGSAQIALGYPDRAIAVLTKARRTFEAHKGVDHPQTLTTVNELALAFWHAGRFDEAVPLYQQVLARRRAALGPDHPQTLLTLNCLAVAHKDAGRLDRALPLYEQALARRRATLGAGHRDTLRSAHNLAWAYADAGLFHKALPLLEEALAGREATLGRDHVETLTTLNVKALVLRATGRFDEALPLLQRALAKARAKLGADHPTTLVFAHGMATAYLDAGRVEQALPLCRRVAEQRRARLGPDHPHTLSAMNALAGAYIGAGRPADARPLLEHTLLKRRALLGPDHPHTLVTMNTLGIVYRQTGKREQAVSMLEQALAKWQARVGPDHPLALSNMNNLAAAYRSAGRLDKALPLFERAVAKQQAVLGVDHPDTLSSMHDLASAYLANKELDRALSLYRTTLASRQAKLGRDHPATLVTMNNLAAAYWARKELSRSVPLYEDTLRLRRARLGPDHPDTLATMASLGINYRDEGRLEEGIDLLKEALERSCKGGRPVPVRLGLVPAILARMYVQTGQFARAEPLFRHELGRRKKAHGANDPRVIVPLRNLCSSLLRQKKYAEAEPFLREHLDLCEKSSPGAWQRFNALCLLGGCLLEQGKLADAEPLLLKGYDGMKRWPGPVAEAREAERAQALRWIIRLYDAQGKKDQAARWARERKAPQGETKKAESRKAKGPPPR